MTRLLKAILATAVACVATSASAQYPSKPIKVIVPFAAGGTGDIVARLVANKVSENTGKVIVVENKTGAGGRIGYDAAAKSPGDGYTFVATDGTYTMMPALYENLPWDHANDLVPVTISAQAPFAVVAQPGARVQTLAELLKQAKAQPGSVKFGSAGAGSVNHIVTELFEREAGIDMLHVPYKGMGDAMTGLLSGTVDMVITAMPTAIGQVKGGRIVPLAVTSAKRSPALPDVPTVAEAGVPGFVTGNWFGLTAPKGTPKEAIDWMQREVAKAVHSPDIRDKLAAQGAEAVGITPDEHAKVMKDDAKRWGDLIRAAGIKAQ